MSSKPRTRHEFLKSAPLLAPMVHLVTILWVIACNFRGTDHALTGYLSLRGAMVVVVVASALHCL